MKKKNNTYRCMLIHAGGSDLCNDIFLVGEIVVRRIFLIKHLRKGIIRPKNDA